MLYNFIKDKLKDLIKENKIDIFKKILFYKNYVIKYKYHYRNIHLRFIHYIYIFIDCLLFLVVCISRRIIFNINVLILIKIDILLYLMLELRSLWNLLIVDLKNILVNCYVCKESIDILLIFKLKKITRFIKYNIFVGC